uniref:Uncharacterized protein n=1 Tax=Branchiostoma floridae TaxID=7739 RepID=C3YJC9_BRAFL|eukprot:XP_002603616.1 hypothetical protein BRAFLDRAFT_93160 [Branchiostoma floridae]
MARSMNNVRDGVVMLPPSPNWFFGGVADATKGGVFAFCAKNSVYLLDVKRTIPCVTGTTQGKYYRFRTGVGHRLTHLSPYPGTTQGTTQGKYYRFRTGVGHRLTHLSPYPGTTQGTTQGKYYRFRTGVGHRLTHLSPYPGTTQGTTQGKYYRFRTGVGHRLTHLSPYPGTTQEETTIVSADQKGFIVKWHYQTGDVQTFCPDPKGHIVSLACSSHQPCLLAAGGDILLWDLRNQKWQALDHSGGTGHSRVVFSITAVQNHIITTSMDRQIILWDLSRVKPQWSLPTLGGFVYALAFSPLTTGQLAIGVGDGMVRIWNTQSGSPFDCLGFWQGTKGKVTAHKLPPATEIAWREDGQFVAIGNEDGSVEVMASHNLRRICIIRTHHRPINKLCWHPMLPDAPALYSYWLASASNQSDVHVHNLLAVIDHKPPGRKPKSKGKAKNRMTEPHKQVAQDLRQPELTRSQEQVGTGPSRDGALSQEDMGGTMGTSLQSEDLLRLLEEKRAQLLRRQKAEDCTSGVPQLSLCEEDIASADSEGQEATGQLKSPTSQRSLMEDVMPVQRTRENAVPIVASAAEGRDPRVNRKKKKGRSLFPLSANMDNRAKCHLQQDCLALTDLTYERAAGDLAAGSGDLAGLGLFFDRRSLYKTFKEESLNHLQNGHLDHSLQLAIWRGDIVGALQMARQHGQLTDWLVAMAPLAGHDVWLQTVEDYSEQLCAQDQHYKAVTFLLACHKVHEAIDLLKNNKMFREAVALAKVRLPPHDPAVLEVYDAWATELQKDHYEQAAKCYLAMQQPCDAAAVLARRGDLETLQVAAKIAAAAGSEDQLSLVACRYAHECQGQCFLGYVVQVWSQYCGLDLTTGNTPQLCQQLTATLTGGSKPANAAKLLCMVSCQVTTGLLYLVGGDVHEAVTHFVAAVHLIHDRGQYYIMKGLLQMLLPQGSFSLRQLDTLTGEKCFMAKVTVQGNCTSLQHILSCLSAFYHVATLYELWWSGPHQAVQMVDSGDGYLVSSATDQPQKCSTDGSYTMKAAASTPEENNTFPATDQMYSVFIQQLQAISAAVLIPDVARRYALEERLAEMESTLHGAAANQRQSRLSKNTSTCNTVQTDGNYTCSTVQADGNNTCSTVQADGNNTCSTVQADGNNTCSTVQADGNNTCSTVQADGNNTCSTVQADGNNTCSTVQADGNNTCSTVQTDGNNTCSTVQADGNNTCSTVQTDGLQTGPSRKNNAEDEEWINRGSLNGNSQMMAGLGVQQLETCQDVNQSTQLSHLKDQLSTIPQGYRILPFPEPVELAMTLVYLCCHWPQNQDIMAAVGHAVISWGLTHSHKSSQHQYFTRWFNKMST